MLLDILGSGMPFVDMLLQLLILVFCVLLSLTVHEMFHGLVARWMGDKTAESLGRLSLNPLHHIDPIGGICLLFFGFGWAKPVPVNPMNFKNKKLGMVFTALGGPLSNFVLAFVAKTISAILLSIEFTSTTSFGFMVAEISFILCEYLAMMNIGLGIFNLIPIPPLDGSKVLNALLPTRMYFQIMQYERYGFILLILLLNVPFFNNLLFTLENGILTAYDTIIGLFL